MITHAHLSSLLLLGNLKDVCSKLFPFREINVRILKHSVLSEENNKSIT